MMLFEWDEDKNEWLKHERGISFEEIEGAIHSGGLLADTPHPNHSRYPHQRMLAVRIGARVYGVPCVKKNDNTYFMKTAYPSRKFIKHFLKN